MPRWDRAKVRDFLNDMATRAGYQTVPMMVKHFELDPSTPAKWSSAKPKRDRAPRAFIELLGAYADDQKLDSRLLVERWEFAKAVEKTPDDELRHFLGQNFERQWEEFAKLSARIEQLTRAVVEGGMGEGRPGLARRRRRAG